MDALGFEARLVTKFGALRIDTNLMLEKERKHSYGKNKWCNR